MMQTLLAAGIASLICLGCHADDGFTGCTSILVSSPDADANHDTIQTALSTAQPGNVLCFKPGRYSLHDELVLTTPNIELRGSQAGEAIFDFAGQVRGPNGLSAISDGLLIQHLTVKNSAAQAIRIQQSTGVTLRDVTVTWDVGSSSQNGGYGIYPTECTDVLIDQCRVSYAEDAGFYVGQSLNVVVQNSEAFGNVVGIEIENSKQSEVSGNHMHDNVAGLFISNLPNLPRHGDAQVRVHDNRIDHNNLKSFAAPGSAVSGVPSGAGIMILAATDTDVHTNTVENNESFGVGVFSYVISGREDYRSDATYDSFPQRIYIHDNELKDNGLAPHDIAASLAAVAGIDKVEDMVWDGELAPMATPTVCFARNGTATFRNIDYANHFAHTNTLLAAVTCDGTSLPAMPPRSPVPIAKAVPTQPYSRLSQYGFFVGDLKAQQPADNVMPYDVAASLYADQSSKLRFLVLPKDGKITFDPSGRWQFPSGTTFIKTFYYDDDPSNPSAGRRLVETRLETLVDETWTLDTYLWDAAQSDATQAVAGKTIHLTQPERDYRVPSASECRICHLSNRQTVPLGPRTRQLNRAVTGGASNQLDLFAARGFFTAPVPAAVTLERLSDPFGTDPLEARARSYLDANCAHCHSDGGTASATGLRLSYETTDLTQLGICRSPVSAGPGSGPFLYDVVPALPDQSIVVYRMRSTEAQVKMPQLPTLTSDDAGSRLISDWISGLSQPACPAR
jgi:parallel beta-helix repeat protein